MNNQRAKDERKKEKINIYRYLNRFKLKKKQPKIKPSTFSQKLNSQSIKNITSNNQRIEPIIDNRIKARLESNLLFLVANNQGNLNDKQMKSPENRFILNDLSNEVEKSNDKQSPFHMMEFKRPEYGTNAMGSFAFDTIENQIRANYGDEAPTLSGISVDFFEKPIECTNTTFMRNEFDCFQREKLESDSITCYESPVLKDNILKKQTKYAKLSPQCDAFDSLECKSEYTTNAMGFATIENQTQPNYDDELPMIGGISSRFSENRLKYAKSTFEREEFSLLPISSKLSYKKIKIEAVNSGSWSREKKASSMPKNTEREHRRKYKIRIKTTNISERSLFPSVKSSSVLNLNVAAKNVYHINNNKKQLIQRM